tara:strand:+ start:3327 stop:4103 length:777 start_codon:yes stop_codon:yes gene_type:complete
MKYFVLIIVLCIQTAVGQGYNKTTQTPLSASQFIGYDSYDNFYTITDQVLSKENATQGYKFTDFQLGNITSVDIINPFNVVVFYAQTNTVILLDNKLSLIEQINFNLLEDIANISSVSNAGGNKLWLFNADSQQLELYNYRNNTKNSISLPIAEIPTDQASDFNYNYLLTPSGVKVYTVFGGLVKSVAFQGGEKVITHKGRVLVVKDNMIYEIIENSFKLLSIKTTQISIQDLQVFEDFLYIYDRENIHSFVVQKPNK